MKLLTITFYNGNAVFITVPFYLTGVSEMSSAPDELVNRHLIYWMLYLKKWLNSHKSIISNLSKFAKLLLITYSIKLCVKIGKEKEKEREKPQKINKGECKRLSLYLNEKLLSDFSYFIYLVFNKFLFQ